MADIVLSNLCKEYENGFKAVKNVNLEIKEKEFLIFVGPSGCGKSTTLRLIAGLEQITSGELWIGDVLANFLEPGERNLSMVFQNYALYPNMNVYKNIAFSLEIRGVPKQEVDRRVREVAELLELSEVLDRRPKDLSGGQRQRVAIGNAIIRNPEILLMDEPLSNLDAKLRSQMRVELATLHKKLGNTIIYVTHDQTEAMTLGTRIAVMDQGEIQQVDTPKQLYSNPVNRFVAGFIGAPAMNFVPGGIVCGDEQCHLWIGKKLIGCSVQLSEWIRRTVFTKEVLVGIRPEDFLDETAKEKQQRDDLSQEQRLLITITHRELLGNEVILYFTLCNQECCMRASVENKSAVGDTISVWVDVDKIHLFNPADGRNLLYEKRNSFLKGQAG
ncbi:MAG: ABC transporter ATP-binding protein [Lachnospiraceae bacterium]|nr:ABC transporter ATP-binding protein [Lachnospiraceae bacterium]